MLLDGYERIVTEVSFSLHMSFHVASNYMKLTFALITIEHTHTKGICIRAHTHTCSLTVGLTYVTRHIRTRNVAGLSPY